MLVPLAGVLVQSLLGERRIAVHLSAVDAPDVLTWTPRTPSVATRSTPPSTCASKPRARVAAPRP